MLGEVRKRADIFLQKLIPEHLGESVLIVSHGDFMRMMTSVILQIDIDSATAFHFDNASYSVFELTENRWKVNTLNRIATDCE
jgi:broad specificity phosphatase PhoE